MGVLFIAVSSDHFSGTDEKAHAENIDCLFGAQHDLCVSLDATVPHHAPDDTMDMREYIRRHGKQRAHTREKQALGKTTGLIAAMPMGSRAEAIRVVATQSHVYALWIRYAAEDRDESEPMIEFSRRPVNAKSNTWSTPEPLHQSQYLRKQSVSVTASDRNVHVIFQVNPPAEADELYHIVIDADGSTAIENIPLVAFAYPHLAVSKDSIHLAFVGTLLSHAPDGYKAPEQGHDSNNVFSMSRAIGSTTWTEPRVEAFTAHTRAHESRIRVHHGVKSVAYLARQSMNDASVFTILDGSGLTVDTIPPHPGETRILSLPDSAGFFAYDIGVRDATFAHYQKGIIRMWRPPLSAESLQFIQSPSIHRRENKLIVAYTLVDASKRRTSYEEQPF